MSIVMQRRKTHTGESDVEPDEWRLRMIPQKSFRIKQNAPNGKGGNIPSIGQKA
jgi:hypothetical protein